MTSWLMFVVIGILGGIAAGLFGVGGGIVIVPALIYWAGFSQHKATGTSLAVLLPPIGLGAVKCSARSARWRIGKRAESPSWPT